MAKNGDQNPQEEDNVMGMTEVPRVLHPPLKRWERNRTKFIYVVAAVLGGFFLNSVAGDLYNRWMPWKDSEDEFVQKIADAQKERFDTLQASLATIRSTLPAEGRDAFKTMERALANVERDSAGLVQQLDLAKREIEALHTVAVARGGVGTGYDFTLSEHNSMDVAGGAIVGLTDVGSNGAYINLTAGGTTIVPRKFARAGESFKYPGMGGRECWVALRSHQDGRPGVASFNTGCQG